MKSLSIRKCPYCEGAGRFLVRSEQRWPDDGRYTPKPGDPTPVECKICGGSGEKPDAVKSGLQ